MKIKLFFRWYDLWIGIFIDKENRSMYICPIPMFGIKISLSVYVVVKLRKMFLPHYVIIGSYTGRPFGCSCGKRGRDEMLREEPGSTVKRITRKKCPICKGN